MMIVLMALALVAGAALSSQTAINAQLAKSVGGQPLVATFISFVVGSVPLLLICLWKADWQSAFQSVPHIAAWKWTGGILGAGFVFTIVMLAPRLGITPTLFLVMFGQLFAAALIDHYGWLGMSVRPLQLWHMVGLAVMALGLLCFFFGQKFFGS